MILSALHVKDDQNGVKIVRRFSIDPAWILLIIAPIVYLVYGFLTPPFQTPDEHQHLFRAYQLAEGELFGEKRGREAGGDLPPGLTRAVVRELGSATPFEAAGRPKPKLAATERLARATPLQSKETPHFTNFAGSVNYAPAGYFPQIVAVWVGRAFDFPVEWIVRLGRVLNAFLTAALLYFACRVLPVGRLLLIVIALLPMTAACAASFGQDGMCIGASSLLTALAVRAVMLRRWTRRETIVLAATTVMVTLAKVVYLPLAALALFPRPANLSLWRWVLPPMASCLVAAVLVVSWLNLTTNIFAPTWHDIPSPSQHLNYLLRHPLDLPRALFDTYIMNGKKLAAELFTFGWLNVGPVMSASLPVLAAVLTALWHGDDRAAELFWTWRSWAIAISLLTVVLLTLAMYIIGTHLGDTNVFRLQGRYFIPVALPLLLPMLRQRRGDPMLTTIIIVTMSILANGAVLKEIWQTYYL